MPDLENLRPRVHKALRSWHSPTVDADSLLDDLLAAHGEEPAANGHLSGPARRLATNRLLLAALKLLEETNSKGAAILKARFQDKQKTSAIAIERNLAVPSIDRLQNKAITQLAEIILAQEVKTRQERIDQLTARLLPATYSRLFGFDTLLNELLAALLHDKGSHILLVTGIGGIGKTALVDAAARAAIASLHFAHAVMIRVESPLASGAAHNPQQQYERIIYDLYRAVLMTEQAVPHAEQLTQLHQAFARAPHLIIIDNLEDGATCALLIEQLRGWSAASRFMLTARVRPALTRVVRHIALNELARDDSFALIRHEAELRGLNSLANAAPDDLEAIYAVVGGNPFALKLVVSLTYTMPVNSILNQLRSGGDVIIDRLYSEIYRLAWQSLSQDARLLLQAMLLAGREGSTPDQLSGSSGLSSAEFWPALQELTSRSLVEIFGTAFERRYGIHQLTQTFLSTSIIGWK